MYDALYFIYNSVIGVYSVFPCSILICNLILFFGIFFYLGLFRFFFTCTIFFKLTKFSIKYVICTLWLVCSKTPDIMHIWFEMIVYFKYKYIYMYVGKNCWVVLGKLSDCIFSCKYSCSCDRHFENR